MSLVYVPSALRSMAYSESWYQYPDYSSILEAFKIRIDQSKTSRNGITWALRKSLPKYSANRIDFKMVNLGRTAGNRFKCILDYTGIGWHIGKPYERNVTCKYPGPTSQLKSPVTHNIIVESSLGENKGTDFGHLAVV